MTEDRRWPPQQPLPKPVDPDSPRGRQLTRELAENRWEVRARVAREAVLAAEDAGLS